MKLSPQFQSLLLGLTIGVLGSFALVFLATNWHFHMSFTVGWRYLLWPSFLFARIGVPESWIALAPVLGVVIFSFTRVLRKNGASYLRRSILIGAFLTVFTAFGIAYVHIAPVPKPAYPPTSRWSHPTDAQWKLYLGAYEEAYRWGIVDNWHNWTGAFADEVREGWVLGFSMGLAEWEATIPGAKNSAIFRVIKQEPASDLSSEQQH